MHYSPLNLLSHYLKEHSSFRENDRTEEEVAELERQPRARSTKRQQQQEASGSQPRNNEAPENLQTQEGQRSDQDIRGARRDPSQTQRDEFDEQLPKRTSQMDRRERLESIPRTIHQREDRQMPTDPFPRRMRDVRDGDQERQQREESDAQFRDDHRMQREQLQDWQPSIRLQQYQEPRRLESMEGQALGRSFGEGITGFVRPRGGGDDTTQEHRSVRQRMSVQWLTGDTQPKPNDDEVDERWLEQLSFHLHGWRLVGRDKCTQRACKGALAQQNWTFELLNFEMNIWE